MGRGRTTTGALRLSLPCLSPLAATGGVVPSLPGEAARLLAESGAPDKRGTKFRR